MQDLKIQQMSVDALRPYARNARTHPRRQIRKIAKSIETFGFVNPVLVDDDLQIIAGHGRVEAAKLLSLKTVPVIKLSHLSEAERRAYVLADNKLALAAGWNRETLAIELQGLSDLGFEVDLTGFEIPEIDIVIESVAESKSDPGPEDRIPDIRQESVSKVGDLWRIGAHRLICGDARDAESFDRLLGSDRADAVFTDPPYNVRMKGNAGGRGRIRHGEFAMASGEMTEAEFVAFLKTTLGHAARVSRDGAVHFICIDWRHVHELYSAAREVHSELLNLCVWAKTNGGMGTLYRSQHELVLVAKVGTAPHLNNVELGRHGRNRTNLWQYQGMTAFRADRAAEYVLHPTIKPVALIADALRDVTKRGDLVLDPFSGSGSTIIAAEKVGRRACAIELDPTYCDVAVRRWQTFTGKQAILEGDGRIFEEVVEARQGAVRGDTTADQLN
jgi:DNA modification methylase